MIGSLPRALEVRGVLYDIRTDYRDILRIIAAFSDPELEPAEKAYICLYIMYEDFEDIPRDDYKEAYQVALKFIDCGAEHNGEQTPRTMDWEQDEQLLFPAVNRVAGYEVRAVEYLHWWTFLGYFMEISEGVYAQVLSMRQKKARGKKLEKWERDFWTRNKDICALRPKLTAEEQAERDRLNALLG